jgi:hypothetical protein
MPNSATGCENNPPPRPPQQVPRIPNPESPNPHSNKMAQTTVANQRRIAKLAACVLF